jgi:hypothetical protein
MLREGSLSHLEKFSILIDKSSFNLDMSFSDFSKVETVKSLNEFLADKSYIDG